MVWGVLWKWRPAGFLLNERKGCSMVTVAKIVQEIDELFGDTSVSQETTRENLQEIIMECQTRIDTLEEM